MTVKDIMDGNNIKSNVLLNLMTAVAAVWTGLAFTMTMHAEPRRAMDGGGIKIEMSPCGSGMMCADSYVQRRRAIMVTLPELNEDRRRDDSDSSSAAGARHTSRDGDESKPTTNLSDRVFYIPEDEYEEDLVTIVKTSSSSITQQRFDPEHPPHEGRRIRRTPSKRQERMGFVSNGVERRDRYREVKGYR